MSKYTTSLNDVRTDFITLHTRSFDPYQLGRSLTLEQEFYGDQFDRMIADIEREAAARALEEAASSPIPREALTNGTRTWLRARAAEIRGDHVHD